MSFQPAEVVSLNGVTERIAHEIQQRVWKGICKRFYWPFFLWIYLTVSLQKPLAYSSHLFPIYFLGESLKVEVQNSTFSVRIGADKSHETLEPTDKRICGVKDLMLESWILMNVWDNLLFSPKRLMKRALVWTSSEEEEFSSDELAWRFRLLRFSEQVAVAVNALAIAWKVCFRFSNSLILGVGR